MKFLSGVLVGILAVLLGAYVIPSHHTAIQYSGTQGNSDLEPDTMPSEPGSPITVADDTANLILGSPIPGGHTVGDLAPDNSEPFDIRSDPGPDGYRVDKTDFDHDTIHLTVFKYRSQEAFQRAMKIAGEGEDTLGLTYSSGSTNDCVILVPDPLWKYDPTTMGHELTHCIYGGFHKGLYPPYYQEHIRSGD